MKFATKCLIEFYSWIILLASVITGSIGVYMIQCGIEPAFVSTPTAVKLMTGVLTYLVIHISGLVWWSFYEKKTAVQLIIPNFDFDSQKKKEKEIAGERTNHNETFEFVFEEEEPKVDYVRSLLTPLGSLKKQ